MSGNGAFSSKQPRLISEGKGWNSQHGMLGQLHISAEEIKPDLGIVLYGKVDPG